MGFEGSLDSVSFADILNTLCKMNKEGTLTISDDRKQKIMYFRDSGITLIGSSQRSSFGEILVQHDKIGPGELENALLEQQETQEELETILVRQGLLTEEEIEETIYDHIEEEICDVFFWENAYFSFHEGPPQPELIDEDSPSLTLAFDVQSILFQISTKIGEWERIRENVPSLSGVLVKNDVPFWEPDTPDILDAYGKIWKLLDGTNDVKDIIRLTELPTLTVCRIISLMIENGLLQPADYDMLLEAAEIFQQRGQMQKCIRFFELALEMQPNEEKLMLQIARAHESIGNTKSAGEYYLQLGNQLSLDEPRQAIKYYEMASSHMPQSFETREKLVDLASHMQNEEKEIYYARNLARLYFEEGEREKSLNLAKDFLRRYPQDLDFHQILADIYLARQELEKAVSELGEIANIYKKRKLLPEYVKTLNQIIEIAPQRSDVKKTLLEVKRAISWQQKRGMIYGSVVGGVVLLLLLLWGGVYELSAKSRYRNMVSSYTDGDYAAAKKWCDEILTDRPWSSIADDALNYKKKIDERLGEIEERINAGRKKLIAQIQRRFGLVKDKIRVANDKTQIDAIKSDLERLTFEYRGFKWSEYSSEIEFLVNEANELIKDREKMLQLHEASSLQETVEILEQQGKWEEAIALWKVLANKDPKWDKKAKDSIARLYKYKLDKDVKEVQEMVKRAGEEENKGDYGAALKHYVQVEEMIRQIEDIVNQEKSLRYTRGQQLDIRYSRDVASSGKNRVQKWETEAEQLTKDMRNMLDQGKIKEAFSFARKIVDDARLSKSQAASQVKLPIQINTVPPGARIRGTELITPCIFFLQPEKIVKMELALSGFAAQRLELSRNSSPIYEIAMKKIRLWDSDIDGQIWQTPVVYKHLLLVADRSGKVIALDRRNGKGHWRVKTRIGLGDILGGIAIFGKNAYFGSNDRNVYAVNARLGKVEWRKQVDAFVQATPVAEENSVVFGTSNGTIYCFDRKTGEIQWRADCGYSIGVSPVKWNNLVIFGSSRGDIRAFHLPSGKQEWQRELPKGIILRGDLQLQGNDLFIGTRDGFVYCLDVRKGNKQWSTKLDSSILGTTVFANRLYSTTSAGYVYCLERLQGNMVWKQKLLHSTDCPPVFSQKRKFLYVGDSRGNLYVLKDDEQGRIFYHESLTKESIRGILIQDEKIYVGSESGQVFALEE